MFARRWSLPSAGKRLLPVLLAAAVLALIPLAARAEAALSPAAQDVTGRTLLPLNLRPEPGTARPPLTVIPAGTTIPISGRNAAATWLATAYAGKSGWVYAPYVALSSGTVRDLPVVAQPAAAPPPTAAPAAPAYTAHLSGVGPHLKTLYQRGQGLGNNPRAFTRVGDCEMAFTTFLHDYDGGSYSLGSYTYLSPVIGHFAGSFAHLGQVANAGMSSSAIFQDYWSDPALCLPGETPLACEYRTHRPSVALIMLRTIDRNAIASGQYRAEVTQAVQMSLDRGVIPVLSTIPYWGPTNPDVTVMNDIVRQIAAGYSVPLWDYWQTSEALPGRGVTGDYHIADPAYTRAYFFDADALQMAVTRRNLEALEVLHAILTQVIQG